MGVCELLGLRAVELFEVLHPVRFVFLNDSNMKRSRARDSLEGSPASKHGVEGRSVRPGLLLRGLVLPRQRT